MPHFAGQATPHARKALCALFCSLAFGLGGCASYRPASREMVVAPAQVRITFPSPRRVAFYSQHGDSLVLDDIVTVEGKVLETGADSVTMKPSRAWRESTPTPWRLGTVETVRLPLEAVEVKKVNRGRTAVALLVLLGGIGLIVGAATSNSDPTPPPSDKSHMW